MRQILFRGKVIKHNPMTNPDDGWVEGFYYQDLCGGVIKNFIKGGEMVWEVYARSVGQFTGLYDKNSTPIFEGDLLRFPPKNKHDEKSYCVYEVYFHDREYCYKHIGFQMNRYHYHGDISGIQQYFNFEPRTTKRMVVIGNIYDNKVKEE